MCVDTFLPSVCFIMCCTVLHCWGVMCRIIEVLFLFQWPLRVPVCILPFFINHLFVSIWKPLNCDWMSSSYSRWWVVRLNCTTKATPNNFLFPVHRSHHPSSPASWSWWSHYSYIVVTSPIVVSSWPRQNDVHVVGLGALWPTLLENAVAVDNLRSPVMIGYLSVTYFLILQTRLGKNFFFPRVTLGENIYVTSPLSNPW